MYRVYEYLLLKVCDITEQIVTNQCRFFIPWENELKNSSETQELLRNISGKHGTLSVAFV